MHRCGSGRRDSSLRIFVSSWRRISRDSAASLSVPRFEEARHWFWRFPLLASGSVDSGNGRTEGYSPVGAYTPSQSDAVVSQDPLPGLCR